MDAIGKVISGNIIKQASNANVKAVDFKELLVESLEKVNADQLNAEALDTKLALGETDNIHEVLIASQKAELSLSFAVEIRNKILESYKEIMRIQL